MALIAVLVLSADTAPPAREPGRRLRLEVPLSHNKTQYVRLHFHPVAEELEIGNRLVNDGNVITGTIRCKYWFM